MSNFTQVLERLTEAGVFGADFDKGMDKLNKQKDAALFKVGAKFFDPDYHGQEVVWTIKQIDSRIFVVGQTPEGKKVQGFYAKPEWLKTLKRA